MSEFYCPATKRTVTVEPGTLINYQGKVGRVTGMAHQSGWADAPNMDYLYLDDDRQVVIGEYDPCLEFEVVTNV